MSRKKILIVEDEESHLRLFRLLFEAKGYLVRGVMDGRTALDALAEERPDLVLLDIMLPKIDGFEVCRKIKTDEKSKDLPVILLTARTTFADKKRGANAGADGYITKPFKSDQAVAMIQGLIGE